MVVAVVGTGVIGGSVGLAARRRLGARVRGVGPEAERAVELGALDEACAGLAEALDGAEAAFVATPVAALPQAVDAVLAAAGEDCVVTDVGSAKRAVTAGRDDPRFVGGHPLAGSERSGVEHAREDLFEGATWYLTPGPRTSGVLYERLHRLLGGLGARPAAIDADVHDRVMAAISHLPHVLANLLVERASEALGDEETVPATGPSFRDATRVAGANPELWPDILLANRDALAGELDAAIARLSGVRDALAGADRDALERWQRDAARRRGALAPAAISRPTVELRVPVPNRPGVVAAIALGLGRAAINISDMTLSPSPDGTRGEVALWVAEDELERARAIVGALGL